MPFAVIVEIEVKAGARKRFDVLLRANAAATLEREPGCLRFDLLDCGEGRRLTLYEIYSDAAAFDAHLATDHYATFAAAARPLVATQTVRTFEVSSPDPNAMEKTVKTGLKAMIGTPNVKIGHFLVEFSSPGIGHILKNAGCDYAVIDMEHSGFGFETVKSTIRYCEAAGLPSIVRTPSREYNHLARACDVGAAGIMVPMVSTPAEARAVVDAVKYFPDGRRGVALGISHDRYRGGPTGEKLAASNREMTLFLQIETKEGVENVDAIAATEGVDCLWLGHFDLSCSLGIPGEFEHPRFTAAVAEIAKACRKHGRSLARLAGDVQGCLDLYRDGFDFISFAGDAWVYQAAVTAGVSAIRSGAEEISSDAAAAPTKARARGGRQ